MPRVREATSLNICHVIGAQVVKQAAVIDDGGGQIAQMAASIAGRLKDSGTDPEVLSTLKRELEEFNIRTGTWEQDWATGEFFEGFKMASATEWDEGYVEPTAPEPKPEPEPEPSPSAVEEHTTSGPNLNEVGKKYVDVTSTQDEDDWDPKYEYKLNLRKMKEDVYGDDLEKEIAEADAYNKKMGIPWRMAKYLTSKPSISPSKTTGTPYDKAGYNVATGELKAPIGKGNPETTVGAHLSGMMIPSMITNLGFKDTNKSRSEKFPNEAILRHEGSHAVTADKGSNILDNKLADYFRKKFYPLYKGKRSPRWDPKYSPLARGKLGFDAVYPEESPMEFIPPATAIQEFAKKTTGSRLKSKEDYENFIKKYDGSREDLPTGVKRWLNYRDMLKPKHSKYRLDALDTIIKEILPGIVRNKSQSEGTLG